MVVDLDMYGTSMEHGSTPMSKPLSYHTREWRGRTMKFKLEFFKQHPRPRYCMARLILGFGAWPWHKWLLLCTLKKWYMDQGASYSPLVDPNRHVLPRKHDRGIRIWTSHVGDMKKYFQSWYVWIGEDDEAQHLIIN